MYIADATNKPRGDRRISEERNIRNGTTVKSPNSTQKIFAAIESDPNTEIEVDLPNQKVTLLASGEEESFVINGYKKENMLNGFDDIDYLQNMKEDILEYAKTRPF